MTDPFSYRLLADVVLLVHACIAAFVVGGLVVIVAGRCVYHVLILIKLDQDQNLSPCCHYLLEE
ncbi:MAG: hypothetical protein HYR49_08920 [Gammaproteobacteria bacterium]|nr:hypothetical protein [Gammaproteobacteria bacterium]